MQNSTFENIVSKDFYPNFTVEEASVPGKTDTIQFIIICLALGVLILATIVGNIFVMVAIVKDRNLNNLSNYLVFSLALADFLVALLVMPIGAIYQVNGEWTMAPELCDFWTCCDVLCCTASILHLLAIALDRFWAVTNVDYARNRDKNRIYAAIIVVWAVSVCVSVAPLFGWKDSNFQQRIEVEKVCLISQDLGYQLFATCSSFYFPLVLILMLYSRIYQEARKRIRRRPGAASQAMILVQKQQTPIFTDSKRSSSSPTSSFEPPSFVVDTTLSCRMDDTASVTTQTVNGLPTSNVAGPPDGGSAIARMLKIGKREKKPKKPENNHAKREKKAAKTLAIITGVFVMCWLPFFVMALLLPLCGEPCDTDFYATTFSVFLWLGYANSMLNPIIYTIFSPDFRSAFRKLLCPTNPSQRPTL